jgi:hypothetical protein
MASLILASSHADPSASALSKIVARRNFSDLPVSILMVASHTARSSSVSRTIYFLFMATSLLTRRFPEFDRLGNPNILTGRSTRSRRKTEVRGQKTEDRGQKSEKITERANFLG